MNEETLLACSTFPEIETARRIAQQLVTENLAACANIIPAVESIYRWQDKIENAQETLVFFQNDCRPLRRVSRIAPRRVVAVVELAPPASCGTRRADARACVAPNARYRKNGRSGRIDCRSPIHPVALSTMSSDTW